MPDSKSFSARVKASDSGSVTAVFSTLNVRDKDGDVTLSGAFTEGEEVLISAYQHASWTGGSGNLPVGKGVIRTTDTEAILEGQFFLDSQTGRDTHAVVKGIGERQEWSFGFDTLDSEPGVHDGEPVTFLRRLKVHEVSPVLIGAGVNTRTLAVKAAGGVDLGHREFARFVKASLERAIREELADVRDALEARAQLDDIARNWRTR